MSILKRLDRVQKIPKDCLTPTPPIPKSVKIELTQKCNYKCAYCSYTFRKTVPQDMDFELFKRITAEMKESGVEEIGVFYVGEPFASPKLLIDAIDYLKQRLHIPYVFLTSNASLARPSVVKDCMAAGLDSLKWSCNSADDEQFEQMMGVNPVLFSIAKENIKSAWEIRESLGYPTKLYASSIMYDKEQEERAKQFLDEIRPYIDAHYWLPLYTMGGVAVDNEVKLGLKPLAGNPGRLDDPVPPIPCWTLFTAGHILADGRMTACCMDGLGKWVVGDLKTQSFIDSWHSKEFQELRQAHIDDKIKGTKCEQCALYV